MLRILHKRIFVLAAKRPSPRQNALKDRPSMLVVALTPLFGVSVCRHDHRQVSNPTRLSSYVCLPQRYRKILIAVADRVSFVLHTYQQKSR
ncbi:hypothetical protein CC79DRAFT_1331845 [Sarocladium strictum]